MAGYRLAYPFDIRQGKAEIPMEIGEKRQVDLQDYAAKLAEEYKVSDESFWSDGVEERRQKGIEYDGLYVLDDQSALHFTEFALWLDDDGKLLRISGKGYLLVK